MRISDWSSDVCSSDLDGEEDGAHHHVKAVEAGRHEEGGTIDAALEAERRVIIFKRLNGAEHHAKPDGAPQALLRALAVAMDQRVMRPGDRKSTRLNSSH